MATVFFNRSKPNSKRRKVMMTRRKAIKAAALAGAALATLPDAFTQNTNVPAAAAAPSGPFTLPPLPYPYDALEPYIDARTMEIHHNRHHAAFIANLNRAVAEFPEVAAMSVDDMLKNLNAIPEKIRTTVRNNGGGHINHSLFWDVLKADGGEPSGDLATAINSTFGSFDTFKENFTRAALGIFVSGWAWLVIGPNRQLNIVTTPNQDSPVMQS
jgi:Fe-Mn family superoxide dismutase